MPLQENVTDLRWISIRQIVTNNSGQNYKSKANIFQIIHKKLVVNCLFIS